MKPTPSFIPNADEVKQYFHRSYQKHGNTAEGADWNSPASQEIRFEQLLKVTQPMEQPFTLLDYGSGVGLLSDYLLKKNYPVSYYYGFDILEPLIQQAQQLYADHPNYTFTTNWNDISQVDYAVASGVFNARLETSYDNWTQYVLQALTDIHHKTQRGFAANFLTKYSDPDKMQERLYYADPCFLFDYAKTHFSKNVAILHDYTLYDFTLIIKK